MRTLILTLIAFSFLLAQQPQKAIFVEPKKGYYDTIETKANEFKAKKKKTKTVMKVDLSNIKIPKSISEFKYVWHNTPISQGITNTCWSFSTTSFFESEIYRLKNKKIRLSPMYNAYLEYIEKATEFVKTRGKTHIGEGSMADALLRLWKKYGCVPYDVYTGLLDGQEVYDHAAMFSEIKSFLESVKKNNFWSETFVIDGIKNILNTYMKEPPTEFTYEGKKWTPQQFFQNYVGLNLDDYYSIISLNKYPFYEKIVYEVPDNWWFSDEYYNVPLNEFMQIINFAIEKNISMSIGGDVSEPGIDSWAKVAVVPEFDIPFDKINDDARMFRFYNGTTYDDHGVHLLGYTDIDGKRWYLIKDSGAGSRNVGDKGYYFFNEDYVKLKIVNFLIHKDGIPENIKKKLNIK
ncbi:MAG TPA: C1 family peptidase [Ignavibacteriales bacterium]|nr:C1 family peptidase [Ignavibacteriales bacterium]HPD66919.1 C1 family peptidase [Ignavibacteriales bacterium]HRR18574.1 C1 family peptidase [Ignavibacteriales bacterium]HRT99998.1 C1 family peptidase [Ignavibacteriales bacterium]